MFQSAVTLWGPVEICLNAAGICDEEDWQTMMKVNFVSTVDLEILAKINLLIYPFHKFPS